MSQTGIGEGADPDKIAALCSDDVEFEIPGDDGALPGDRTEGGTQRGCRLHSWPAESDRTGQV